MQKSLYALLALFVLGQGAATAATVLLERTSSPGFVMQSYAISTQCRLLDNGQIVLEKQLGLLKASQTLPIKLSIASIKSTIAAAALGKITSESFPVDVPTKFYRAYIKQSNGKLKTVLLSEENGGSGEKKTNAAQEAVSLRNFIDLTCGNTAQ